MHACSRLSSPASTSRAPEATTRATGAPSATPLPVQSHSLYSLLAIVHPALTPYSPAGGGSLWVPRRPVRFYLLPGGALPAARLLQHEHLCALWHRRRCLPAHVQAEGLDRVSRAARAAVFFAFMACSIAGGFLEEEEKRIDKTAVADRLFPAAQRLDVGTRGAATTGPFGPPSLPLAS